MVAGAVGDMELTAYAREADAAARRIDGWWDEPLSSVQVLVVTHPPQLRQLSAAAARDLEGAAAMVADVPFPVPAPYPLRPSARARGGPVVVVNGAQMQALSPRARAVVMTHEAVHVATRFTTAPAMPLWLSEGFADHVAHRAVGVAPTVALRDALAAARTGKHFAFPTDVEFATDPERADLAYQRAHLACAYVAQRYGHSALTRLYRGMASAARSAKSVPPPGPAAGDTSVVTWQDDMVRRELGVGRQQLRADITAYARSLAMDAAGSSPPPTARPQRARFPRLLFWSEDEVR